MHTTLKQIMKREKISGKMLAGWLKLSPESFRRMLRKEIKMTVDTFNDALDKMGYKIMIVKKEDLV